MDGNGRVDHFAASVEQLANDNDDAKDTDHDTDNDNNIYVIEPTVGRRLLLEMGHSDNDNDTIPTNRN